MLPTEIPALVGGRGTCALAGLDGKPPGALCYPQEIGRSAFGLTFKAVASSTRAALAFAAGGLAVATVGFHPLIQL